MSNFQSSVEVRTPVESLDIYSKLPEIKSVSPEMRIDFSRFVGKPFHLATTQWTTAQAVATDILSMGMPSSVLSLNRNASAPFDLAALYNLRACFLVQIAGTPMHNGILIASVVPRVVNTTNDGSSILHTYQTAPHAFLYANSSSAICVEVPWYSNTKLRFTPSVNDAQDQLGLAPTPIATPADYAQLKLRVLSPLGAGAAASTALTVTVSVIFSEMNFYIPKATYVPQSSNRELTSSKRSFCERLLCLAGCCRCAYCVAETSVCAIAQSSNMSFSSSTTKVLDGLTSSFKSYTSDIIDSARSWVRNYTGLHSPNVRNPGMRSVVALRNNLNYVDNETFYYKLDPYSQHIQPIEEYFSDTSVDEMDVSYLCQKPMAVSRVTINTTQASGTLVFSAPIHPKMFRARSAVVGGAQTLAMTAPIDKLASMSRFFSGDMELILQWGGSNYHMVKFLICSEYYSSFEMTQNATTMASVQNLPTKQVEFSSGGQIQTYDLPMGALFDHIPITSDHLTNSMVHGRVSIYVLQPLVVSGTVSTSADLIIHMRAKPNFKLYGYATENFVAGPGFTPSFVLSSEDGPLEVDYPLAARPDDLATLLKEKIVVKRRSALGVPPSYAFTMRPATADGASLYPFALQTGQLDGRRVCFVVPHKTASSYSVEGASSVLLKKLETATALKKRGLESSMSSSTVPTIAVPQSSTCNVTPENVPCAEELVQPPSLPPPPVSDIFRPIVNLRDHGRRVLPYGRSVVAASDIIADQGNYIIDIYTLLTSAGGITTVSVLQSLHSMFLGYRGGLRFKIVIRGVNNVQAFYLPPSPVVADSGAAFAGAERYRLRSAYPSALNATQDAAIEAKFAALTTTGGGTYQGPQFETTDLARPSGSGNYVSLVNNVSNLNSSFTVLEFELPYMNVSRFVGFANAANATSFYCSDLGYIVLGVDPQLSNAAVPAVLNAQFDIYVGMSDDARFMYNVVASPLYFNVLTGSVLDTVYEGPVIDVLSLPTLSAPTYFVGAAAQ